MSLCNADPIVVTGDKRAALQQLINRSGTTPVYVFFFSPSCPHCITLNEAFQHYRAQCMEKKLNAVMIVINLNTSPELFEQYDVTTFPQVMVFVNGKRVKHIVGADIDELADAFRLAK